MGICMIPSSAHEAPPPNGMGLQVAPPLPFYLQAIGSISEVQPLIRLVFVGFLTTSPAFTRYMLPFRRPT